MQGLEGTHCSPADVPVMLLWKSTENPRQQPKKGERDKIEADEETKNIWGVCARYHFVLFYFDPVSGS